MLRIKNIAKYALIGLTIGAYAIKAEMREETRKTDTTVQTVHTEIKNTESKPKTKQQTIDSLIIEGDSTFIKQQDYSKAMQFYRQAMQIDTNNIDAINGVAFMFYYLGDSSMAKGDSLEAKKIYKKSLEFYNKGLKLNPTNVIMLYNRSFIKKKLGDKKGAEQDYERCGESIMRGRK
jgi:tetratricopeptide (TPR) repeat protein